MPAAIYGTSRYGDPLAVYAPVRKEPRIMSQDNLSQLSMLPADKTALLAATRNMPGMDTELAKLSPFFPTGRREAKPAKTG